MEPKPIRTNNAIRLSTYFTAVKNHVDQVRIALITDREPFGKLRRRGSVAMAPTPSSAK